MSEVKIQYNPTAIILNGVKIAEGLKANMIIEEAEQSSDRTGLPFYTALLNIAQKYRSKKM